MEIKHPSFKPVLSRFKILKHISPRRSQITGTACGSWVSDPPADGKGASPWPRAGSAATAQQGPAQLPAALWSETQLNEEGGGKGSTKTGHTALRLDATRLRGSQLEFKMQHLARPHSGGAQHPPAPHVYCQNTTFNTLNIQVKLRHHSVYVFSTTRNELFIL